MISYDQFIESKRIDDAPDGLNKIGVIRQSLFGFQQDIVRWALRRGRAAVFADCGLGKTAMQLEWAHHVPGRVIVVAPLVVGHQTEREGAKFGIDCRYARKDEGDRITVTNYEMLDRFNPADFTGIVLDESSILKSYTGKFRNYIIDEWGRVPFRLCATATPAPNDYMELGNHAEFLGAMTRTEMLSMFFVHDGGETQKWRLKGHAESEFWRWLCSWAVMIRKPSDIGYDDGNFVLPKCHIHEKTIKVNYDDPMGDFLFAMEAQTLQDRIKARRGSVYERCEAAAALANASTRPWIMWCNLNDESKTLTSMIPDAVEVSGSDSLGIKEDRMRGFTEGRHRVIVTKPSIAGFGMNWQHCADMSFVGLSDSYEAFYQAIRRCWRFGQTREVNAWIITSDIEGAVVANIKRKEDDARRMADNMVVHMHSMNESAVRGIQSLNKEYVACKRMGLPVFLASTSPSNSSATNVGGAV